MTSKGGSLSASAEAAPAGAARPNKSRDDKDFQARWIAFGMMLKGKADGYGIEWRGTSFEKWMNEITFAEVWAEHKEQENHGT